MLNDNRKFDYWIFNRSCFCEHSSQLWSSYSAGATADIIFLVATQSWLYIIGYQVTLVHMDCGMWEIKAVEVGNTLHYMLLGGGVERRLMRASWRVVSVIVWTGVVCFSRSWLAADDLHMLGWISKCSRACASCRLLSCLLIKPHMQGLVTAGCAASPRKNTGDVASLHNTCILHASRTSPANLAWSFAVCHH